MAKRFLPGVETWYVSDSPQTRFSGVFEDDGDTGYFYAYDREEPSEPILDAVHIYDVANVTERTLESIVEIVWSSDGLKAALLLNEYPHAVIDFAGRATYSRSQFLSGCERWQHKTWDDGLLEQFRNVLP